MILIGSHPAQGENKSFWRFDRFCSFCLFFLGFFVIFGDYEQVLCTSRVLKAYPHDAISCTQPVSNSLIRKLFLWFQHYCTKKSYDANRVVCTYL